MLLKKYPQLVVGVILVLLFVVSIIVSSQEFTTVDENVHIPAGYSYLRYGDMRLNPEHPPLIKDLAGIPLLFLNPTFPVDQTYWINEEEWIVGNAFLYGMGNDAEAILFWARVPIVFVAMGLGLLIYHWTRQLAGTLAGLFALTLYAFDPNVLAHDHLVTTDVGSAAFIFMATYAFVRFIKQPNTRNLVIFGIAFGVAQLVKFSAVVLFPLFALLTLVYGFAKPLPLDADTAKPQSARRWELVWAYVWSYAIAVILCFVTIWLVYSINTLNMPADKVKAIALAAFKADNLPSQIAKDFVGWLAGIPVLKPLAVYFLGVFMVVLHVAEGSSYYFMGGINDHGTPLYFPTVFLLKETLPFLLLLLTGMVYALSRLWLGWSDKSRKFREKYVAYVGQNIAQIAMLGFVVFYAYICVAGNLNLGFRHLFPLLPFLYVLTAMGNANALGWLLEKRHINATQATAIVGFVLAWIVAIPVFAYPSYISYFNEMAGGHAKGYKYLTDSNYDWGQDLKRLRQWVDKYNECAGRQSPTCDLDYRPPTNAPIEKIHIDYFGGTNPRYYFGDDFITWYSDLKPEPGWYAISAQRYQISTHKPAEPDTWNYRWLQSYPMLSRAGDSIFIFHIPDDSRLPTSSDSLKRLGDGEK